MNLKIEIFYWKKNFHNILRINNGRSNDYIIIFMLYKYLI